MAYGVSDTAIGSIFIDAEIAQLVEQRIRNAWVEGSSPSGVTEALAEMQALFCKIR